MPVKFFCHCVRTIDNTPFFDQLILEQEFLISISIHPKFSVTIGYIKVPFYTYNIMVYDLYRQKNILRGLIYEKRQWNLRDYLIISNEILF